MTTHQSAISAPNTYVLFTKRKVKMAGYLAKFSFCIFMDWDEVELHKNTKREQSQYPAILTDQALSIKDLLYDISRLHVAFCFYFCVCQFLLQTYSWNSSTFLFSFSMMFSFFLFSSSIPTENLQKIFYILVENILWKKTFMNPLGLWRHFIVWTKRAILSRQYHSTLPARVANHTVGFGSSCLLTELR